MDYDKMDDDGAQIHVAGTFGRVALKKYEKHELRDYIKTMLDGSDILYNSVIALEIDDEKITLQCRLHKTAISKTAVDEVDDVFQAVDGHIETWVTTESVMRHPEIYR